MHNGNFGKVLRIRSSFAKDSNGLEVYIRGAERGRLGYFCFDCGRDMEAIKPLASKPRPYFRHIVTDVKIDKPCVYSDETYRHKIAKELLVAGKSIRVPKVAAFPPKGFDGPTKLIRPSRTVTAFSVGVEIDFWEDNSGNLCWDKVENGQERKFWVRPDVVFFDNLKKPILFIELVATHRPDKEKLERLRKLEIDTVTVKIPTESSQEIEECFKHTECTKWLYNKEYEGADYFQLPGASTARFSDDDREQRKILGERYACTKNRLGNLIRKIERSLESEHYLSITKELRGTIEELEREQSRRSERMAELNQQAYESLGERRAAIRNRQEKLDRVHQYIQTKSERLDDDFYKELGDRRSKNQMVQNRLDRLRQAFAQRFEERTRAIELEESSIESLTRFSTEGSAGEGSSNAVAHERIRGEIGDTTESIQQTEAAIGRTQEELETIQENFEREQNAIIDRFRKEEEIERQRFEWLKRNEERAIEKLGSEEDEFTNILAFRRREAQQRIESEEGDLIQAISGEDLGEGSPLSGKIKELVRARQLLSDYSVMFEAYSRHEQVLRYLNSEAFKNWVKERKAGGNF